jgi:hypothetical protein
VAGTSAIWQYLGNGQWGAVRQGLNATNLSGTIPLANLPKTVVTNNGTGVTLSGRFAGSGAGLTNLAATNLTGTFADARLSTNVALLSAPQAFTGANRFAGAVTLTNAANTVAGVFAGNGTGLTNLAATNLTGTVADARLSTNVAQLSANQAFTGANRFAGVGVLTNAANTLAGTLSGNGGGLTNLNAAAISGGITTNLLIGGHTFYITNGIIIKLQ